MPDGNTLRGKVLGVTRKDKPKEKEGRDWTLYQVKISDHRTGSVNEYGWFSTKGGDLKTDHSYEFLWEMSGEYRNIKEMIQEIDEPDGALSADKNNATSEADGRSRSKEEMRWTAATEIAVNMIGHQPRPTPEQTDDDWKARIQLLTPWLYEHLQAFPVDAPQEAPQEPLFPEDEEEPPARRQPAKPAPRAEATTPPAKTETQTTQNPTARMSEDDLQLAVLGAGMDWPTFEKEVLQTTWAEWTSHGGTASAAYKRFETWQERNPNGVAA